MKDSVTYINRYRDNIQFEILDKSTIKMTGYGQYFRYGFPNNYKAAYNAFLNGQLVHGVPFMSEEDFKKQIHEHPELKRYLRLVTSDMSIIDMVDPSGGPYLCSGFDMKMFFTRKRKPLIIKEFEMQPDCILIKLER